ncbi:MAG: hypothetical protein ACTS73_02640 [Arsenophonus sp. NEOnobi-MAG3]
MVSTGFADERLSHLSVGNNGYLLQQTIKTGIENIEIKCLMSRIAGATEYASIAFC